MPTATCFRHTGRETGRACTRCGRPACPDCLVDAPVGAQCFECVQAAAPSHGRRLAMRWRGERILATKLVVAVTVAAYVLVSLRDGGFSRLGATAGNLALVGPKVHDGEWWRLLTAALVHANPIHILFNMLVLWQVGLLLEPAAGRLRFTLLYVVSVLAGSAGALIAQPHAATVGASGGVFGVAAATTLLMQRQGVRFWDTGFGPLLLINLALGLFIPNISIGGHVGGLVGGALAVEAMLQARRAQLPRLGLAGAALVGVVAFAIALAAATR